MDKTIFAKLFDTEVGQVLVKQDEGDDGPEVRFFFKPPLLGICSIAVNFKDTDDGWDDSDKFFAGIEEEQAFNVANEAIKKMQGI